jgi:hypothetical protein
MGATSCKDHELEIVDDPITIVTKESLKYQSYTEPIMVRPEPKAQVEEKVTEENESSLMQGELLKPQPGSKNKYQSRWVVMTPTELKYYKNEYSACFWHEKPINHISYSDVIDFIEKPYEGIYEFEIVLLTLLITPGKNTKNPVKNKENHRFGMNSWGCRMKSIENLETKFHFACRDKNTYEKWVKSIRKAIKKSINL